MQKFILIANSFLLTFVIDNSSFSQTQKQHYFAPFQGKKVFCSTSYNEKAFVTIKGHQVSIVIENHKITGTYKSTKILLTNDPEEVEYRKNAPAKYHYGTYYVIEKDYFSILLPENGEYNYYELCK